MRSLFPAVFVISLMVVPAHGDFAVERWVDRSAAIELAHLSASRPSQPTLSNLRHEGDVETLQRPLILDSAITAKIVVDGATSLRVHVRGAAPGTTIWVAGEHDDAFEPFEVMDHSGWLPTTVGTVVYVRSEDAGTLQIEKLAIGSSRADTASNTCLEDVACSRSSNDPELEAASRAIALIRFVRDNASYVCTGGLVNDSTKSGTPYFLTAHHCISTAEEAASIEAVWDDRATSCGVSASSTKALRTWGAELVATSAATDVALLRLNRIPVNRVFLDVERAPLAEGTVTYRISHAEGKPQKYSAGVVRTTGAGCSSAPRTQFIYTSPSAGAVATGSSGAPLLLPGLRVAGQLLGLCGPAPNDACATFNDVVDGSIAASWPVLAPHLDPPATPRRRGAGR